ncbi:MAG: dephospho-CoA kinase [Campylobacteraceae bacterium]|jgi:dephospho-CoA kinase|nr:dephospho-CoA kinase [Campylobacteraceae bacterium]
MSAKLKIVLTGGIGSGKSSVSKMLENSGFAVIDADNIAHEVLAKSVSKIRENFGEKYIKNGSIDRKKLGELVFGDENSRKILETLLHKDIFEHITQKAREFEKLNQPYIADIPLFFEREGVYEADLVVVVYTPKDAQLLRVIERDALSRSAAQGRLQAQIDIETKKLKADFVIDNSKDLPHLRSEVERFIKFVKDRYAG